MNQNTAQVICLSDRFFCRFGKSDRVQTAWCLAGSQLFNNKDDLQQVVNKLTSKGKKFEVKNVQLGMEAK